MADIVSPEKRSQMMAGIRGKDTKPELLIRKALHSQGFRYRLHEKKLPGKPDIVLPRYQSVIMINGCFWHQHNCHLFKWPSTRKEFWQEKISHNKIKDIENIAALENAGWRVLEIWECALKGKTKLLFEEVIDKTVNWLVSDDKNMEICGTKQNNTRG